ncbi:MAG: PQQ-dependent sugar dehydrogenase [Sphingomonadaceae bacterium]|nr:PQQ-dependent sugar dehydrogenase [Sphingomonadaceae bacterium]
MQRIVSVLSSLAVVIAAILLGAVFSGITHQLIRLALPLPDVPAGRGEIVAALMHLVPAGLLSFGAASLFFPQGLFASAERVAKQIYAWGAAWGVGSLYLFLMTSDVFPHQLLVGAFVIGIVLFWASYALFGQDRTVAGRHGVGARLLAAVGATLRTALKPAAWLAIFVTILPLIAAVLYVKDQDFRDGVAEFRVRQNVSVDGSWMTVPINTKTQLLQPIMIRPEPGRTDSLLVLERAGRLFRMAYPDDGTKELLLDFTRAVGEVNLENGALGFDFDPGYGPDGNGLVYVFFTSFTPDRQINYLSRFDIGLPEEKTRLASRFDLLALGRPPSQYHNGGHVETGSDGLLYISVGEMGMDTSHQHIDRTLSGGILRIDVRGEGGETIPIGKQPLDGKTQGYAIPSDNPFVEVPGALYEFYAYGLRNPFRFAFDGETGLLWTGDVGSTVWEEVNAVEKGGNYQFPYDEGGRKTSFEKPGIVWGAEHGPVHAYQHTAYDRSVIGGIVYRGKRWPELDGQYIFGDNYSGTFWSIPARNEKVEHVRTLGQATKYAQRGFTSIIQTPDERIVITIMGSSSAPNGEIVELVPKKGGGKLSLVGEGAVAAAAGPEKMTEASIHESYVTNCGRCHGATGKGDGPDAELLREQFGAPPTDFRDAAFKAKSRAEIRKVIAQGGGAAGLSDAMPPWAGVLEDDEIEALTDHVRAMPAE